MKKYNLLFVLTLALIVISCGSEKTDNRIKEEATNGNDSPEWIDLTSADAWRGYNKNTLPSNWKIKEGVIECFGAAGDEGGDIISQELFDNFEFVLEWKLTAGGNSGIMYHCVEDKQYHSPYQTGPEVQIIDDIGFAEPLEEWQKTGADYNMYNADPGKELKTIGEWNKMKIIFNNKHVEHWLNGKKIVEYEAWTNDWYQRKAQSKWANMPHWGIAGSGHIGLQDHGAGVWFRNVKVRRL